MIKPREKYPKMIIFNDLQSGVDKTQKIHNNPTGFTLNKGEKMNPYIGVTGFTHHEEVKKALKLFPLAFPYSLMVGVLASTKTLAGGKTKYLRRYPRVEEIASIFSDHPSALNLVHYATDDVNSLPEQLEKLEKLTGPLHHGYQINACWPSVEIMKRIRKDHRCLILQVGPMAMKEYGKDPTRIAEKIKEYEGVITHVLIDASGGLGIPINIQFATDVTLAIQATQTQIVVGIAGGLSPETIADTAVLTYLYKLLCVDAEGKLRGAENDVLDLYKMRIYLERAITIRRRHPLL